MNRLSMPLLAAAALGLSACGGVRDYSGYIASEELTTAIEPGIDNKQSVEATLGRPTFVGQFDPNRWYYVSQTTQQFAFRRPRVTDADILSIAFDDAGNVVSIDQGGQELAVAIDPNQDETPTMGRNKSFFDEIFGSIGSVGQGGLPGQGGQR